MFKITPKPEQVFTPRSSIVNLEMFIHREEIEKKFSKAIRKSKHLIIHGESGCGKTWLYKKLLSENECDYEVINAASINDECGINDVLGHALARINQMEYTGYEESKKAEFNALVSKGVLQHTSKKGKRKQEPFLELIREINRKGKGRTCYLIFENIENIIRNEKHSKKLFSLLLLLDDESYAKHNVKIIIVGTPSDIISYLAFASEDQTILNRILELPEVPRVDLKQIEGFIEKGFKELLKYTINYSTDEKAIERGKLLDKDFFGEVLEYFTDGIPQYLQELCLEIALEAENNQKIISEDVIQDSIRTWLLETANSEYARVIKNCNSSRTKHGRRNQCIFSMSQIPSLEFTTQEIEEKLFKIFPKSTEGKKIKLSQILFNLLNSPSPIIKRNPHSKMYRFVTPKTKIITRWMFTWLPDQNIEIRKNIDIGKIV
jgi:hypothetical protein